MSSPMLFGLSLLVLVSVPSVDSKSNLCLMCTVLEKEIDSMASSLHSLRCLFFSCFSDDLLDLFIDSMGRVVEPLEVSAIVIVFRANVS